VPCKCGVRFEGLWREDVREESRDDMREHALRPLPVSVYFMSFVGTMAWHTNS